MSTSRYSQRGVSATKSEVHQAIKNLDKGLFPTAFCKILPDIAGGSEQHCNIMHADTAGTKTSLAYIYWKETGDLSVWKGVAQDAIVMNIDDMACVGCVDGIVLSSTIGRNKLKVPGEVIKAIIDGTNEFISKMHDHGVGLHLAGGETADVGDIVRTVDIGITAFARMLKADLVVNDIKPGDVIIGLSSFGQTTYEDAYNGGMGSNGLTSARHDILSGVYKTRYPESFDASIADDLIYSGSKSLLEKVDIPGYGLKTVGELILSPTRTYLPVLNKVFEEMRESISGIIHCTGGAQTKVMKFASKVRMVKNNLFDLPPLFQMIENESGASREEMYQVFNMGHRLEIYISDNQKQTVLDICNDFGVTAQQVGHVEKSDQTEVVIIDKKGEYRY